MFFCVPENPLWLSLIEHFRGGLPISGIMGKGFAPADSGERTWTT
jgi:hypothetical protein